MLKLYCSVCKGGRLYSLLISKTKEKSVFGFCNLLAQLFFWLFSFDLKFKPFRTRLTEKRRQRAFTFSLTCVLKHKDSAACLTSSNMALPKIQGLIKRTIWTYYIVSATERNRNAAIKCKKINRCDGHHSSKTECQNYICTVGPLVEEARHIITTLKSICCERSLWSESTGETKSCCWHATHTGTHAQGGKKKKKKEGIQDPGKEEALNWTWLHGRKKETIIKHTSNNNERQREQLKLSPIWPWLPLLLKWRELLIW